MYGSHDSDASTSYNSENESDSGKLQRHRGKSISSESSHSYPTKEKQYKKEKQNGARSHKKRVHSHSTHNSSRDHEHDDGHEIEENHLSKSKNDSNSNGNNPHYKSTMNSYRTSSDTSQHSSNSHRDRKSHRSHKSSSHKSSSHKSNPSHSLKQSRTSNVTSTTKQSHTSDKPTKRKQKKNSHGSHASHHSHNSHHSHSHHSSSNHSHDKKEANNESKSKPKLKTSKLDEFSKQNRKFLRLNSEDDAQSMISEQSIEFLGHVQNNQISIKAVPKNKKYTANKRMDEDYIDENRSDSREHDYDYWKPSNHREESTHSLGANSLNSITRDTVSELKKEESGDTLSPSHSRSSSSRSHSDSRSHSHSDSRSATHSNDGDNRSITELTTSDQFSLNHHNGGMIVKNKNESNMEIIQAENTKNNQQQKPRPRLKNNASDITDQSYFSTESSVVSPLSERYHNVNGHQGYGQKNRYHGQYIYNQGSKKHMLSQPMDRVSIRSHQKNVSHNSKSSRHRNGGHMDDGDTVSIVSGQSEAASLNSISTSHTDANSHYIHNNKPLLKSNQHSNNSRSSHRDEHQSELMKKIQESRALHHEHQDTMDTESYMSVIYTDETRSVYTDDQTTQRRHKSMDTVTTKDYEPSIFTDIDYDIDYENVGIKDIVWTQKLKYLKNRLIFLEKEITNLPTQNKRMDKLMLYVSLEFLSINPDEKKANDRLVEWWDLHKYSWLDKHDPQKEDTLLSQNWNEIGIPLTRDPGSTPTHHGKTLFEDIYDNLKHTEWIDPLSIQNHSRSQSNDEDRPMNDIQEDEDDDEDDNKSVIPSTIIFKQSKYKDYDQRDVRSYLIDATDFLNFLHRQTTGDLLRSKSGLVGYVNVSVEDKIAECTPWRLHRVFQTSSWNRLNYEQNKRLEQKSDALVRSTDIKSDQIEAFRIEITRLKEELQEQQARHSQMREHYGMQLESIYKQQHNRPSSARSSNRGSSGNRHKQPNQQYLGHKQGRRSNNSHDSHEIIDMSPSPASGHSQLMSFDPNQQYSRSVPPQEDGDSHLQHASSHSPHYNNDHPQYHHAERQRSSQTANNNKTTTANNNNDSRFSPMMHSKSHASSSSLTHKRHFTQPQHGIAQKKKRSKGRIKENDKNIVIYTGNDPHHPHHLNHHFQIQKYDDASMYSQDYHHEDGTHSGPHTAAHPSDEHSDSAKYAQQQYYARERDAHRSKPNLYKKKSNKQQQQQHYDYNREQNHYDHNREQNHYDDPRYHTQGKNGKRNKKTKAAAKLKVKVKKGKSNKTKMIDSKVSKPSPVPQQMTLNQTQRRNMVINKSKRALATWKLYVDRYEYIKKRYPTQIADRNKAWLQWTKMLDARDKNPNKELSKSELWSYIDFARMSISRYANWIWWPERPDLIQLNPQKIKTINKAKKSKSASNGGNIKDQNRTYINDKQYYDHQLNLIFTKKFAIVMDFNLFLFETYANPANIQETLAYEHSLLSLASSTNVVVSRKNSKDFYLNTSGKDEYRYLQFRCDGKDDDDDDAQRNEWMEELDYQIHIVHDLLSIPNIKLKIADPNATVWLPTPCVTKENINAKTNTVTSIPKTGQV